MGGKIRLVAGKLFAQTLHSVTEHEGDESGPAWQQRDAKLFGQRVAKVAAAQSGDRQCAGGNNQRLAGECLA